MPTREEPFQEYIPGARVRLIVRLEDYGTGNTPEPPPRPPQLRRGKKDTGDPASLEVVQRDGAYLLVGPGDDPNSLGSPQEQQTSSDDLTHVIDGILPTYATVNRNGTRIADTASIEIKFRDMPLDPRVIRACAVQVFMGTVSADDYQKGLNGEANVNATPSGSLPFNVVPDEYVDEHGRKRTNLRFEGWVDEWEDEWPDGEAPLITLECTDNTRLLIEQDAPPKLTIPVDVPVDEAIATYLSNFPQFRGLSVEYRPNVSRDSVPVLEDVLQKTKYQPKLGPTPSSGGTSKLTVWDYITDVAGSIGHIVRFEGTTVILQRARTLYDNRLSGRPNDPFTGRVLSSGRVLTNRLYLYGRNIAEMSFKRRFATYAPFNVEVRCFDSGRKKTLIARFPLQDDRQKRISPGEASDQKWIVFTVDGVKDEETLRVVAQSIYEQVGRNELEASFITKNLASFGGGNLDPDALDVFPGDAIDVEVKRVEDGFNTVLDVEAQMTSRAGNFLRTLGFSSRFASAYQKAITNVGFPTTFRVRAFSLDWDSTAEGIVLDFQCVNYIEVRADKRLADGEELDVEDTRQGSPVEIVVEDEDF